MHLNWMVGALGLGALACGGGDRETSPASEAVAQSSIKPDLKTTVEAFQGGADSAESLLTKWYARSPMEWEMSVDSMVLKPDQMDQLFDCKTTESQQQLEGMRVEFMGHLETEFERLSSEQRGTVVTQELLRARSIRTVELAVGEALDGCVLKRALRWHTVRSTVLSMDSTGQEVQEVHRCGMLEIDNRWFLKGVPGASMWKSTLRFTS